MYKFDKELAIKKAQLSLKKTILSAAIATSAITFNGCSTLVDDANEVVETQVDNENDAYKEGYNDGYVEAQKNMLYERANLLAHEEERLYLSISSENGNDYIAPLDSVKCFRIETDDKDKFYVIECDDINKLRSNDSTYVFTNMLDDSYVTSSTLKHYFSVSAREYINMCFGNALLQEQYDSFKQSDNNYGCIGMDFSAFTNSNTYEKIKNIPGPTRKLPENELENSNQSKTISNEELEQYGISPDSTYEEEKPKTR